MQAFDESAVRAVLRPYEQLIAGIVIDSWRIWRSLPSDVLLALSKGRPRANVMASLMHSRLADLEEVEGIELVERYDTTSILVKDTVLVRFKKLDESGMSRNYPTQRALGFNMQLPLPDIPQVIRVDAGYVLDKAGIRIDDVMIALRIADRVHWKYSIADESRVVSVPEPKPVPQRAAKSRVTVKEEGRDHDKQLYDTD